ncbi:Aste57867_14662 [Aphanomyces stellatus]|uniref:Aste57867_14662 protein n=1 Tax=Aphanomyces stellatus TaxID=120398 RepID=A0A485L3X0_9STRA|nr:hypothetical protein As57867_014607 [Aphanomyces stellatus]VFT91480.1 Aste57867_14662 [Aphanomyces stellatus]
MSSKRARGAQKKSKKLQALEMQQQKDAAKSDLLEVVPLVPTAGNKTLQPILKTVHVPRQETPLDDHEKTDEDDDDDDDDEDLILIPRPIEFCARFVPKANWTKDDLQSNAAFALSIPSFHEIDGHIVYAILIETPHHIWTVKKRYSEFSAFSHALQLKEIVWELPPKTWFRVTQDAALVDRRDRLEAACVELVRRDSLDQLLRDFFQFDVFALSVTPSSP